MRGWALRGIGFQSPWRQLNHPYAKRCRLCDRSGEFEELALGTPGTSTEPAALYPHITLPGFASAVSQVYNIRIYGGWHHRPLPITIPDDRGYNQAGLEVSPEGLTHEFGKPAAADREPALRRGSPLPGVSTSWGDDAPTDHLPETMGIAANIPVQQGYIAVRGHQGT